MEIVQRILGKVVGQEISPDELEFVSGGAMKLPTCTHGEVTFLGSDDNFMCDDY